MRHRIQVISKLLKYHSKAKRRHHLIHERCVESIQGSPGEVQIRLPEESKWLLGGCRLRQEGEGDGSDEPGYVSPRPISFWRDDTSVLSGKHNYGAYTDDSLQYAARKAFYFRLSLFIRPSKMETGIYWCDLAADDTIMSSHECMKTFA